MDQLGGLDSGVTDLNEIAKSRGLLMFEIPLYRASQ